MYWLVFKTTYLLKPTNQVVHQLLFAMKNLCLLITGLILSACSPNSDMRIAESQQKWIEDVNTGIMFRADSRPGEGKEKGREIVFGPQTEMEAFSKERYWSGGIYGQSAGGWIYPMWLEEHEAARNAMKRDGGFS